MCGICGLVTLGAETAPEEPLRRMARALAHRGPDDEQVLTLPGAGLGFRRLGIIDPAGSRQPLANEDATAWLVCNGAIYNYRELRAALRAKGHSFSTDGDAEVAVHAYEEWGDAFPDRLRGMFALGLWDARRRRLLLARDRMGIKPLFVARAGKALLFASEIRAIRAAGLVSDELDWEALDLYLSLLHVPTPRTAFAAVRKVPAAGLAVFDPSGLSSGTYWVPPGEERGACDLDAGAARLRALLEESVRLHLQSDVPIGFFLSGGLDSSAVVALAASTGSRPVRTFSVGFENRSHNELPFARAVATAFGCEHHEFTVRADAADVLPEIVAAFDEPFGDSSAVPAFYICRAAAGSVKVVLGGDGGDELFAGYEWTRRQRFVDRWRRLPPGVRRAVRQALAARGGRAGFAGRLARFADDAARAPIEGYVRRISCFPEAMKSDLYDGELARARSARAVLEIVEPYFREHADDAVVAMNRADLGVYLPDDDLCKVDRMTMCHSLEGRVPLLDRRVADFALSLPMSLKLRGTTSKFVLKRAVADLLPRCVLRQRKQGFSVPVSAWMRKDLHSEARRLLTSAGSRTRGMLRGDAVRRMLDGHLAGREEHGHRLWAMMVLEIWLRLCVDSFGGNARGVRLGDL